MTDALPDDVARLESAYRAAPDDDDLLDDLVGAYSRHEQLRGTDRRMELLCRYIERRPTGSWGGTPVFHVNHEKWPDGFRRVEAAWFRAMQQHPNEPKVVTSTAVFIFYADRARAMELLRGETRLRPNNGHVWLELGRATRDLRERLTALVRARELLNAFPNLDVWIATTQLDVDEFSAAAASANELLARAEAARATLGEVLAWPERGDELYARVWAHADSREAGPALLDALNHYSENHHWGHTVAGLVAAHDANWTAAAEHLRRSSQVTGSARLVSYGPSMRLASVLCTQGLWSEVAGYLADCGKFWDDERLTQWRAQVAHKELPDFPKR